MTTLFSWVSVDARGPSAIYICSDSRISWGTSRKTWDSARKVYAPRSTDIFGYCGDVVFPSLVLGQLSDLIGQGLIWDEDTSAVDRHQLIVEHLERSSLFKRGADIRDFSVVHAARDGEGMSSSFALWKTMYYSKNDQWVDEAIAVGRDLSRSKLLVTLGTGAEHLRKSMLDWTSGDQGMVARAIFSAFCDTLRNGSDKFSGGVPQLVSLARKGKAKTVGYSNGEERFIYGTSLPYTSALDALEWVDNLFQRISPRDLMLLSRAQKHARPKSVKV